VSEAAIELVRRAYGDGFDARDADLVIAISREDVLLRTSGLIPGLGGTFQGHDGVRAFLAGLLDSFSEFRFVPERMTAYGPEIVAVDLFGVGTGRGSGAEVRTEMSHVIVFRGDRIAELEAFLDREQGHARAHERAGTGPTA
jgi:ketosteroid isomerase-like protein